MKSDSSSNTNEAQIQTLMDEWVHAVEARDSKRLLSNYADDVLVYDLMQNHFYRGTEPYRRHMEGWFSAWQGPIHIERKDLSLTVGEDVAFANCLTKSSGTGLNGKPQGGCVRVTVGFRKIDGRWKAVHEHVSMPFDMETMQAMPVLEKA